MAISYEQALRGKKGYVCDRRCLAEPINKEDSINEAKRKIKIKNDKTLDEIKSTCKDNERIEFFIGKSYIEKNKNEVALDSQDPSTWDATNGVGSSWGNHKEYDDDAKDNLIVMQVIQEKQVPVGRYERITKDQSPQEDYALALEKMLIEEYMDEYKDGPTVCTNKSTEPGKLSKKVYPGYVIYMYVYKRIQPKPAKEDEEQPIYPINPSPPDPIHKPKPSPNIPPPEPLHPDFTPFPVKPNPNPNPNFPKPPYDHPTKDDSVKKVTEKLKEDLNFRD